MKGKKILIVEDEGVSALSLQAALGKMGYVPVGIAYTGREAIRMALDLKPDVILMDIHIKGDMDGIITTQKINESSDIPVIYLTAYADDDTIRRALATSPLSYLIKPYNPRELLLAIELALLRTQMEESLKESEARYRGLFDRSLNMIQIIRPDGLFVHVNPAWKKNLGYSDEDIRTLSIFDIIHPDAKEHCSAIFNDIISGSEARTIETQFLTKDKKTIWVEGNCSPIRKDGSVVSLSGIFQNVTGRKQTEAMLLKNAEYLKKRQTEYRNLVQLNTEAMLILDPDYSIVFANPAAENIFGRSTEKLSGTPFGYIITSGELTEIEIPRWDGTIVIAEIRVSGISWEDKPAYMVIIRDITERKQMEQKINESEKSFRGLFNTVEEAIFIINVDGNFLEVNKGALDMYGQPRNFFLGHSSDILFAPGTFDIGLIINRLEQALEHKSQQFEFTGCRSNGGTFPAECRLYRGFYFGKDVIISLVIDITERKRAEAALRESDERTLIYIKEAAMRLKNPIEVVEQNISTMIMDSESGETTIEEIIPQLRLQVRNMEQIRQNIIELNNTIVKGFRDISPASKEFLTE